MNQRIFIATVFGLVLLAFGGFYYVFFARSFVPSAPPVTQPQAAATHPPQPGVPGNGKPAAPELAASQSSPEPAPTEKPVAEPAPVPAPAQSPPESVAPASTGGKATAQTIEAEIARSEQAELQVVLKKHFPDEYKQMIDTMVAKRNEGISDEAFGRELFEQIQAIMRSKLKFAAGADIAVIDKLAKNEIDLFHALASEGAPFCLTVLGKEDKPPPGRPPDSVRRMLRLGTIYRFEAIVNGMPNFHPIEPLKQAEMVGFQAGLVSHGLTFENVRNGSFLTQEGNEPGKPCMMIEKLYRTVTELGDETRRKLYSGMFFLGRDR